MTRFGN